MRIFDFDSYKKFIVARIDASPKGGRGQVRLIASHLRVHTSLISQIVRGSKHLTLEQAVDLAAYFGLNPIETDYLLTLVEWERAGSTALKKFFLEKRERLLRQSKKVSALFSKSQSLSESQRAIFYSQWYFSAIRLLTDIPAFQTREAIAEHLKLSQATARAAVDFLLSAGLVVEKKGVLECGPTWTFASDGTPHAARHHTNWRLKALERIEQRREHEVQITLPVTLSVKDRAKLRKMIFKFVEESKELVESSPAEVLSILTLDLFDAK